MREILVGLRMQGFFRDQDDMSNIFADELAMFENPLAKSKFQVTPAKTRSATRREQRAVDQRDGDSVDGNGTGRATQRPTATPPRGRPARPSRLSRLATLALTLALFCPRAPPTREVGRLRRLGPRLQRHVLVFHGTPRRVVQSRDGAHQSNRRQVHVLHRTSWIPRQLKRFEKDKVREVVPLCRQGGRH